MNEIDPSTTETGIPHDESPPPSKPCQPGGRLSSSWRVICAVMIGFPLIFGGAVFIFQRKMLYFPRPYEPAEKRMIIGKTVQAIPYKTAAGRQVAYYRAPKVHPDRAPGCLWVLFGGNAMRALDWLDFVERHSDPAAGYLLIDYPGYGQCEGQATLQSIRESSEAALNALARQFAVAPAVLEQNLNVLGHSVGAAAGMQFAVLHPVRRVVLLSPFTTLMEAARYHVGRPLCWLLLDRFDNRARLAELARHVPRPSVTIIHGDVDEIVPVDMGRELARLHPGWIHYQEIKGSDHNSIIDLAEAGILTAMGKGK